MDLRGFMDRNLNGSCLKFSVLLIPTNLRCIQIQQYPDFWDLIGNLNSNLTDFIMEKELQTFILWSEFNRKIYKIISIFS